MLKKIVIGFTALIVLLVLVALFALLPGLVQIRNVEIVIPEFEQIDAAFELADQLEMPTNIQYINTATQETPLGPMGFLGVLITWADGKQFLIDAGMKPEEAKKFGANLELIGASPIQTFAPIEAVLGGYVDNVEGIGFTHLHTDHTLGVSDICIALRSRNEGAVIWQTQAQATLQNFFTKQGQAVINESDCEKAVLSDDLIKEVPGFNGLFAIAAGGHTPGSTIFVTQLQGKTWIFAGDLTNAMVDIHNNQDKGWAYSYILVPEDTKLLEKWRLWLNAADQRDNTSVLVAHDIKAFEASGLQAWQEPSENTVE